MPKPIKEVSKKELIKEVSEITEPDGSFPTRDERATRRIMVQKELAPLLEEHKKLQGEINKLILELDILEKLDALEDAEEGKLQIQFKNPI